MSKLAKNLQGAPPSGVTQRRHGPSNRCRAIYEPDIEDAKAIDEFRHRPDESWRTAQDFVDTKLGLPSSQRIPNDKFRYHWNRGCGCWPDDLRQR